MNLLVRRILAEAVDLAVCYIIALILQTAMPLHVSIPLFADWFDQALWMFLVAVLYDTVLLSVFTDTPGKKYMRIHVETADGYDFSMSRSLLRALIKNAELFFLYGLGAALSVYRMTRDLHSSLHDYAAGTVVWKNKKKKNI